MIIYEHKKQEERRNKMVTNAETLMAVHTHTHTHWKRLTNGLVISSLVLAYDKIEEENIRLSKHIKSM